MNQFAFAREILKNKSFLIFVYILFFCAFGNWVSLYDQDEAAYFGFSQEMLESGNWIVPSFPFSEPHRKTPFHFWTGAISLKIFGYSEFAFRLPTVFATLGSFLLTFLIAKHFFQDRVAYLSILILSTSFYFPLTGKIALVDGTLTFFQMLGFYSLVKLYRTPESLSWKLVFYFALGIGVLVKGPPILIFLGGILFLCLLRPEHRFLTISLQPWFWGWFSLLPLLIWGRLAWIQTNGEFIKWLLDWYIFRRATNPVFGQSGPPGTYLVLFFVGFFPWSYYFLKKGKELLSSFKREFTELFQRNLQKKDTKLLFFGLIFGWFFYEPLSSKLPSYTLAAYPIIAILLAKKLEVVQIPTLLVNTAFVFQIALLMFVTFYIEPLRKDTYNLAQELNSTFQVGRVAHHIEDFAIPSLAVYSHLKWSKIHTWEEIQNLTDKSLVIISSKQMFLIPSHWQKVGNPQRIFLYDRNRTIDLQAFESSR